jgi:hypothetical protein
MTMKKNFERYMRNILFAAGGFVPLADIGSQSSKLGNLYGSSDLSGFINGLFKFAIAVGAIGAVLRLAYAGYLYMGSADMWSNKSAARAVISDVTLGLLLLLAIWLILYQINPDILTLNALKNITPVSTPQSQSAPAQTTQPTFQSSVIQTCTSDDIANGLCVPQ